MKEPEFFIGEEVIYKLREDALEQLKLNACWKPKKYNWKARITHKIFSGGSLSKFVYYIKYYKDNSPNVTFSWMLTLAEDTEPKKRFDGRKIFR